MDTSKEYIGMCRAATGIQTNWSSEDGDFIYRPPFSYKQGLSHIVESEHVWISNMLDGATKERDVWLPRQDQLQDMMDYVDCAAESIESFYQWWEIYSQHHYSTRESMEQLWLAFVMKEKYNKKWNGEEWINQE